MYKAWALEVNEDNVCAILSESGGSLNRSMVFAWIHANGEGYFIRDPESPLDCCLIPKESFPKLYFFISPDSGALFNEVLRKE